MKLCGFDVGLDKPFFLIAGPCVVESEQLQMDVAGHLKEITSALGIPFIFKSSFDKANRSSGTSFRGPGMKKGLEILAKVRKEGLMSVEGDIENPEASPIFSKYPNLVNDHHIMEFVTDYLRMMVGGNLNAFEIESLMDAEMETHHSEAHVAVHCVSKVADGVPAFGIVVAVMVDEPGNGVYYGGEVAAPVFSKVVQQTLNRLGVLPDLAVEPRIVQAEPESF